MRNTPMRRAVLPAFVVLAVLLAQRGGVGPSAPTATSSAKSAPPVPGTGPFSLITEPDDGIAPVLSAIDRTKRSVDLVMYELSDIQVERALAAAHDRGVAVRVLLDRGYDGKHGADNVAAYRYLRSRGVQVQWTSSRFTLTHEKALITDGTSAIIMTFNLTPRYYATSRDFGVVDTNSADVAAIDRTFDDDRRNVGAAASSSGGDLVWSPGSQGTLVALIDEARSSLLVYNEEMADRTVEDALGRAARRGVDVEVVMTYSRKWAAAFRRLEAAGVHVRTYAADAPLYIHAKMIAVDGAVAFVGSENFSYTSLEKNRELGVVVSSPDIVRSLTATFEKDRTEKK